MPDIRLYYYRNTCRSATATAGVYEQGDREVGWEGSRRSELNSMRPAQLVTKMQGGARDRHKSRQG